MYVSFAAIRCYHAQEAVQLQVLQIAMASVYGLVGVAVYKSWLPAACLGALLLAVPMVRLVAWSPLRSCCAMFFDRQLHFMLPSSGYWVDVLVQVLFDKGLIIDPIPVSAYPALLNCA